MEEEGGLSRKIIKFDVSYEFGNSFFQQWVNNVHYVSRNTNHNKLHKPKYIQIYLFRRVINSMGGCEMEY